MKYPRNNLFSRKISTYENIGALLLVYVTRLRVYVENNDDNFTFSEIFIKSFILLKIRHVKQNVLMS